MTACKTGLEACAGCQLGHAFHTHANSQPSSKHLRLPFCLPLMMQLELSEPGNSLDSFTKQAAEGHINCLLRQH